MTGWLVLLSIAVVAEAVALVVLYRRTLELELELQELERARLGNEAVRPSAPVSQPDKASEPVPAETAPESVPETVREPAPPADEEPPVRKISTDPPPIRPPTRRPSPVANWVAIQRQDVLIDALLDEWTEACVGASEVGWVLGVPTGDTLLSAWARAVGGAEIADPPGSFATWFVGEIGKATRRGLTGRDVAEARDAPARELMKAAARLLKGLSEDLALEAKIPTGVGPKHRHEWLVDEHIAQTICNPSVAGVVQPLMVLRPLLRRGEKVLLEGEVA